MAPRHSTWTDAGPGRASETMQELGVRRVDLAWDSSTRQAASRYVRSWARDRALSSSVIDRMSAAVGAELVVGPPFEARGVTLRLRWLDLDRVGVELRWRRALAAGSAAGGAEGVARRIVVDTR